VLFYEKMDPFLEGRVELLLEVISFSEKDDPFLEGSICFWNGGMRRGATKGWVTLLVGESIKPLARSWEGARFSERFLKGRTHSWKRGLVPRRKDPFLEEKNVSEKKNP
jgi:hypothetical protein